MSIPTVAASLLAYFSRFDLRAIARTHDRGRLVSTKDPSGAQAAWWMRAADIGPVLTRARQDHGDVPAAARAVGVKAIEHSAAVQRAEQLVDKLDTRMRTAQSTGALKQFNAEYRERRQQAFVQGRNFMSYSAARSRLRQALSEVAAGKAAPGIIRRVFEGA